MRHRRIVVAVAAVVAVASSCGGTDDGEATTTTADPVRTTVVTAAPSSTESATTTSATTTTSPGDVLIATELRDGIPDTPAGYRVALYGDSLSWETAEHLGDQLRHGGRLALDNRSFPGVAVCDFLPQMRTDAADGTLWAAVLLFTGNAFTPCMADTSGAPLAGEAAWEKFATDLDEAIGVLTAAGARVYLPTLPVSRTQYAELEAGTIDLTDSQRVNDVLVAAAANHAGVTVVPAADAVTGPSGAYVEALPCLPVEPCTGGLDADGVPVNVIRGPEGNHFCPGGYADYDALEGLCPTWDSGAFRYAAAIAGPIVEAAYAQQSGRPPVPR